MIAKKIIRAPFDGRLGIRQVNVGQTLRVGEELIPLYADDPIYVEFAVPQRLLSEIKLGLKLRLKTDGIPAPMEGTITAINPVIDEVTRMTVVQGTVRNPDGLLSAGQYAQVDVIFPDTLNVLAIPVTAVIAATYGDSVFVVEPKKDADGHLVEGQFTARQQVVKTGLRRGDYVAVTEGLEPGARVVSAGAFKLINGATVLLDDKMQPETSLTPTPDNS